MKKVLPISNPKFPQRAFGVIAVIMLVAFLFSLKPVAEIVKKGVEMLGVKFPPIEVFQEANNNVLYGCLAGLVVIVGFAAVFPIVKIALVVVGAAVVAYSVMRLFKNIFPNYGDTDLTKK